MKVKTSDLMPLSPVTRKAVQRKDFSKEGDRVDSDNSTL